MSTAPTDLDRQAERDLLGTAVRAEPRGLAQIFALVEPADFIYGRHRTMWEALWEVAAAGQPVEPGTVVDYLEARGWLEAAGGLVAVGDLWNLSLTGATAVHYARRLAARARRRRIVGAAAKLASAVADPTADLDTAVHAGVEELLEAGRGDCDGLVGASSVFDDVIALRDQGPARGYDCGYGDLDRLYKPAPGQLSVWTGIPSHGKSTFADQYLVRLADRHDLRFVFFSPERDRADHVARLAVLRASKPLAKLDDQALRDAMNWVDRHFSWIDTTEVVTVSSLLAHVRLAKATRNIRGFVIDPWNWLETAKPRDVTLSEHIGRCLAEIMRFARRTQLLAWIVAHPTKMRQHESGKAQGLYYVPRPYDISESAHWFNRPDWCLSIWRDHLAVPQDQPDADPERDPRIVDIHVQKVRSDDLGQVGVASLRFDPSTRRYHALTRHLQAV